MAKSKRKYLRTIIRHKRYVMVECFKVWLYRQGITHDLSKFGKTEFSINAQFYNWNSIWNEREKVKAGYQHSRLHHFHTNPHHLSFRVYINNGEISALKIPEKYVLELCCDFIGAGKVYNKWKRQRTEPLQYRKDNVDKTYVHPETQKEISIYLEHYALFGTLK